MRNIIYYIASSIDGYICGPGEDVSLFTRESNLVQKYLEDLKDFDTVLMGKNTYEFGFQCGISPGQTPYEHMVNYVVSSGASYPSIDPNLIIIPPRIEEIQKIKEKEGADIYLCGGGVLAKWLLENGLIDVIKLKLNPIILGSGIKLFENLNKQYTLNFTSIESFSHGLHLITYNLK